MLRFLTVAALSVVTSGCMIGLTMLVPSKNEPTVTQAGTTPNQPTSTRSGADAPAPTPPPAPVQPTNTATSPTSGTGVPPIRARLLGTWLAEDTSQGLDRVTFMNYPPNTPNPNPAGGKVEALFNGTRILGDFLISGNQLAMQFPGEDPVVHAFEILNDGRLRIGAALYTKG